MNGIGSDLAANYAAQTERLGMQRYEDCCPDPDRCRCTDRDPYCSACADRGCPKCDPQGSAA